MAKKKIVKRTAGTAGGKSELDKLFKNHPNMQMLLLMLTLTVILTLFFIPR